MAKSGIFFLRETGGGDHLSPKPMREKAVGIGNVLAMHSDGGDKK
jgi:hypothetical protein